MQLIEELDQEITKGKKPKVQVGDQVGVGENLFAIIIKWLPLKQVNIK